MRKSSAAKSAASSPPVPARISTITFLSSLGSLGSSRRFSSYSTFSRRSLRWRSSSCASCFISASSLSMSICLVLEQALFDLFPLAVLLDHGGQIGMGPSELLVARGIAQALPARRAAPSFPDTWSQSVRAFQKESPWMHLQIKSKEPDGPTRKAAALAGRKRKS